MLVQVQVQALVRASKIKIIITTMIMVEIL